jgi:small subunit ribosomal protein S18
MARTGFRGRRSAKDLNRKVKKKPCVLCRDHVEWVDYKDVTLLRRYMSDRGKIRARRVTGNCAQHQRDVAQAIKTARELVLLPYTQRTVTERPGARRGPREREREGGRPGVPRQPRPAEASGNGASGGVAPEQRGDGDGVAMDGGPRAGTDEEGTAPDAVAATPGDGPGNGNGDASPTEGKAP